MFCFDNDKGGKTMKNITILGAGGKMGSRITDSLLRNGYSPLLVESADAGRKHIASKGLHITDTDTALADCDAVIFALPDRLLGELTAKYVPKVNPGTLIILLDPAAVFANEAYIRNDCTTAVIHPCHPQLFFEQPTQEARNDHFGGVAALQDIVIAHVNGDRSLFDSFALPLSKAMFDPVMNSFEITVDQMALLEPAATEVVNTALIQCMTEVVEEVVKSGVPEAAARSFILGHLQMGLAIYFLKTNPLSDAAKIAAAHGYETVLQPTWREAMGIEYTRAVTKKMLHPEQFL